MKHNIAPEHGHAVLRWHAAGLLTLIVLVNIAVWLLAFAVFGHNATLMSMVVLAYSFGLRHAVDADHIAAIDNVTRKMMQQGKKPIGIGAFFSLGHSTIVILATALVAAATMLLRDRLEKWHQIGSVIGTSVSAIFLMIVALLNLVILLDVWKKFRQVKQGIPLQSQQLDTLHLGGGWLSRLCRPLFGLVSRNWHMYLVGFLFGLGFDTATEIGLLSISATGAGQGMQFWHLMLFPAAFAAGMILIDTLDNYVMIGAYGWAFSRPVRKLYYNLTITGASVVVALFIGGLEALGLIIDKLELQGNIWHKIAVLNDNLGHLGFWMVGLFIGCWLLSMAWYYLCGYDKLQVDTSR
ncbi:HoxN/HupN/NixA family nickel/cobalt transporter [Mixta intestinalis]|uniref:Nickel/cobalt efflux system n=1 Tax=Mixta intestinalis TaxID=1615494 RepID=A0A6P1PW61_9GAMM|nr:HoxN/HupN/NixA family nickel/cobalt transporter [Mixta intestinalis]QHM70059.1 High-affinity nickel transport protein [Mixta intestinalis]